MSFCGSYPLPLKKTVSDYISEKTDDIFFEYPPCLEGIKRCVREKTFPQKRRDVLADVLTQQYSKVFDVISPEISKNISQLRKGAYSVCCGQQIPPFISPSLIIYKIATTIRLSIDLNKKIPDQNFVPIFWMASEDHDKEEISQWAWGQSMQKWHSLQSGSVGRFHLKDFQTILKNTLPSATPLWEKILNHAYQPDHTLAQATRIVLDYLFKKWGLIVLDPDNTELKNIALPLFKKELETPFITKNCVETTLELKKKGYEAPVNPYGGNLFHVEKNHREKIPFEQDEYFPSKQNSHPKKQRDTLYQNPDRLSPNVLLRPLYQEWILPNVAFIGGGAEVCYWLQLRKCFEGASLKMPVVLLRSSVCLIEEKLWGFWQKFDLKLEDISAPLEKWQRTALGNKKVEIEKYRENSQKIISEMRRELLTLDRGFDSAVDALNTKQTKLFDALKKKWMRHQKEKNSTDMLKLQRIREHLYPFGILQERIASFLPVVMGNPNIISDIIDETDPLHPKGIAHIIR